jgi:anti-sigma B factor antagonist
VLPVRCLLLFVDLVFVDLLPDPFYDALLRAGARCDNAMALRMETDIAGDVVILYCAGRLVFGDESAAFRERIRNILMGTHQIVVNLGAVEYIDSGGLGTLVGTLASTRNRNGEIKLVRPTKRVIELLQRTRLDHVFKSYDSDEEAVAAFHDNQ